MESIKLGDISPQEAEDYVRNTVEKFKLKIMAEQAKAELILLYETQIEDLTMMSKIELGDDVIKEIKRLKQIIHSA